MTGPTLKGCRAQCAVCGEFFGSYRAFDRHRLGDFANPGEWRHHRRCLTDAEMDATGWARNGRGFLLAPDARRAGAGGTRAAREPTRYPCTRGDAMKPRSRVRHKGRSESGGTFTAFPHAIQDCANWRLCSATAIKMLCDVARQYNGRNNGDLCAALSVLRPYGWNSPETVLWALRELRHHGFLLLTRQGGLNGPSLYAVTWKPIDECGGKLTCAKPSPIAPGDWKEPREPFKRPRKKQNTSTPSVADRYAIRSSESKKAA